MKMKFKMEFIKDVITKNFEAVFVLSLIVSIALTNFFVTQELAFLNFYFLPVIISGYYLGWRRTVLSATLCIVFITLYFLLYPDHFTMESTRREVALHLLAWGSFLIIAGAVVGRLQEKLQRETLTIGKLNLELLKKQEELRLANRSLEEDTDNLEQMVQQKTVDLEESRSILEVMKGKVEETLYSTMDASVAKLIIEGRLRDEKKKISVMFTDLSGFTAYSETLQPELVIRDLNRYFSEMEEVLFAYNAHIDKYQGDGIMCEFGTPVDYVNYRLMAVICALKMQEKMATQNYPWKMRIGIASGMAIVGLIGAKRQSYTTIGDVVNLASRFEKAASPGAILIDNNTLEGIRPFIDVELKLDVNLSGSFVKEVRTNIKKVGEKLFQEKTNAIRADLYYQIGKLYFEIMEIDEAVGSFEQALQLRPDDTNFKIAFAEATLQKENFCKIRIKGKAKRVAAYEVIGLKDVLRDRKKITSEFYKKYNSALELIDIPDDVILPSEALDGRIGHGKVVGLLSYAIAGELEIESKQKKISILQAGFLADIGFEAIPRHLLNRSKGGLSSEEYQEYLRHSIEGTIILKKNGFRDKPLLDMIYHSHEKYDGSGFPSGLQGKKIPIGARIIAVADTYDTLTSWHPCRERWDMKAAFDELQREVQKGDFDTEVVQALIRVLS
ncbi:MAG: HD domain-containing protein [Candidatus Electrothrix sp. AR4]|nr:HD domain-containing protein [Candidatus Electrothrix sp. AR4]